LQRRDVRERPVAEAYWFVCRTRSRAEKKTDALLQRWGFQSYLPLVERERQWSDRKKRVEFPLFPGYVFALCLLHEVRLIRRVPGVAGIVGTDGHPTPVHPDELDAVRTMVETARRTGVEPLPIDFLQPGQAVRVTGGPFAGMHGILIDRRGGTRVAVRLTAIRQAVSVEMDRGYLAPIRGAGARHPDRPGRPRRGTG